MASPDGEFHNTEPRTREERVAARSREALEQNMLRTRRGNYHVYSHPGNPVVPEPASPMFAPESDRFKRDAAGEMHEHKLEAWRRQQETFERKRVEMMEKEQQRCERMAAESAAEAARMEAVRAAGLRGKQNKGSEHFNIITLGYHETPQGQALQFKDEVTRYRAVLRSQNLHNKNHSVSHNIITGEARHNPVLVPPAPMRPAGPEQHGNGSPY
ncbi:MAG: flagellar associated protein [Monoraphidium minutum]|nr:MAG: flagellar associated protein [Monoraphidium minutum]